MDIEVSRGFIFLIAGTLLLVLLGVELFLYSVKTPRDINKKKQPKLNFLYTAVYANGINGTVILRYGNGINEKYIICNLKDLSGIEDFNLYIEGYGSEQDVIFQKKEDGTIVAMHPAMAAKLP